MKKLLLTLTALVLAGCANLETITPEEATRGAEAARAWLDVIAEARNVITHDK